MKKVISLLFSLMLANSSFIYSTLQDDDTTAASPILVSNTLNNIFTIIDKIKKLDGFEYNENTDTSYATLPNLTIEEENQLLSLLTWSHEILENEYLIQKNKKRLVNIANLSFTVASIVTVATGVVCMILIPDCKEIICPLGYGDVYSPSVGSICYLNGAALEFAQNSIAQGNDPALYQGDYDCEGVSFVPATIEVLENCVTSMVFVPIVSGTPFWLAGIASHTKRCFAKFKSLFIQPASITFECFDVNNDVVNLLNQKFENIDHVVSNAFKQAYKKYLKYGQIMDV